MNKKAQERAVLAANQLREHFSLTDTPKAGLILGTGWGDLLELKDEKNLPLHKIPHFAELDALEGHKRVVSVGQCGGKLVMALRGRVHLNEDFCNARLGECVRLQIQMMLELGIRTFILTNAAGALEDKAKLGDVIVADGFVTLFAPDMPLKGGEFCSPDDVLDSVLEGVAVKSKPDGLCVKKGGYAMVRGPFFEGRAYDKKILAQSGASCVGMSTVPEACIIALYKPQGAKALALSYITNDDKEEHSHEENLRRAKADAPLLGELLTSVIENLP